MHGFLRSLALSIPAVRHLYQANEMHRERISALEHDLAETTEYMHRARQELAKTGDLVWEERMRADEVKAKHAAAESERESLELQLYVLRSDLQRAAARNEALVHEVRRLEGEVTQRDSDATSLSELAEQAAKAAASSVADSIRPLLEQVGRRLSN